MAYQIALAYSKECEQELLEKGFEKREVYIRSAPSPGVSTDVTKREIELGDSDFFKMRHKPFQFVTTSWWGASNE